MMCSNQCHDVPVLLLQEIAPHYVKISKTKIVEPIGEPYGKLDWIASVMLL